MNLLGSMYINTKKHFNPIFAGVNPRSRQAELTDQFLAEWRAHRHIDPERLLRDTLAYTHENVPFYRRYFARNPGRDASRLSDWPVLSRHLLRDELAGLQSSEAGRWKCWTHASGGSTGQPVAVVHDEYFAARANALRRLCGELFFEGPHFNQLILWGMTKEVDCDEGIGVTGRLKNELRTLMGLKTTHINTYEFTRQKFQEAVYVLQHQKPSFIFGYAGSVYELAKYLDEQGVLLPRRPLMVGTTAQTLHPFMRERIESVFGCRVCDHYGSREVGPVAWQHRDGRMYFPKFFAHIEVVDDRDQPVKPGQRGRILITTLHNFSMPLIRYDIGDIGVRGEDASFWGYSFATLEQIDGRSTEEFINERGSRICAPFFINLFYYREWLDQFHLVQRDYKHIEILYRPKAGHDSVPDHERAEIESRIRSVMSDRCRIDWKRVDEIPTTKAGKRLFIRREV